MFPVLPLITDLKTVEEFSIVGQVLIPSNITKPLKHFAQQFDVDVFIDAKDLSIDEIIEWLNCGIKQIFVSLDKFKECIDHGLPDYRFGVYGADKFVLGYKCSIIVDSKVDKEYLDRKVYIRDNTDLIKEDYIPITSSEKLTTKKNGDKISISKLFIETLTTDRNDGLYTTLVTTPSNVSLGVVYSSKESIAAAIEEKVGVYQSRKRKDELWYKGKTSGATQKVLRIFKDCDSDCIQFIVEPKEGYGFCHRSENYSCFSGETKGLAKLDETLKQRLNDAPEGSYTKRLFNDDKLLIAKLKEELDELIEAKGKDEVSWECADLFYFALCYCIKNGVSLSDVEKNLDVKSLKVSRRKGDAKAKYVEKEGSEKEVADFKMKVIKSGDDFSEAMNRPVQKTSDIMKLVLPIIEQVKNQGDDALLELTAKFDGVELETPVLNAPFPPELMDISDEMKEAINLSMSNIEKFHAAQLPKEKVMSVETCPGVKCSRFAKPIENVGLYVPGGTAVLPSTAMMLGVPAKVAGCKNIIVASPPSRQTGKLTPEVVYVAHKLNAKSIVMAGGAQAVTAMAYGTKSIIKCDKILGPGNQFVTAAKMYVQNDTQALCSIDMPAGPSEVLVIADEKADADFVASDLLSQAEHGVDSQVILIGVELSESKLSEFEQAVKSQAEKLPRKEIVAKCLTHSYILLVDSYEEAFKLSNKYAPEHLILQIEQANKYVPDYIENAGSVFVGALSPESCGDYSSGTNHTLPTYGYARQYSGVNTATFQKFITAQDVTEEGLKSIGKAVMTLANVEGLEAHRRAVEIRMEKLNLL
ncbi:unnamed protein product [Candida verbasci]|uniref:Histidine biosynthesis trifunctional protein n=1 Tax=Candida verbasci TaxID=1227364 RepID=A0A9W4XBM9_9ASCO|nr:unnamed protein product [Candida verbasci]